jgi:hypothetical protein
MANKKIQMVILVITLAIGTVLTSCATQIGQFTMASTKNVDLSRLGEFNRTSKEIKAQDSTVYILGIFQVKTAKMQAAMDKALARIPGAVALVDVRISTKRSNLFFVVLDSYIISGTALVDPQIVLGGKSSETLPPQLVKFSPEGEITGTTALTNEEYIAYFSNSMYIPEKK